MNPTLQTESSPCPGSPPFGARHPEIGLFLPREVTIGRWMNKGTNRQESSRTTDREMRNKSENSWDQAGRHPCLLEPCQRVGLQTATLISDEEERLGEEEFTPSSTLFLHPLLASITLSQQICRGHATRSINWINKDVRH